MDSSSARIPPTDEGKVKAQTSGDPQWATGQVWTLWGDDL